MAEKNYHANGQAVESKSPRGRLQMNKAAHVWQPCSFNEN